MKWIRRNWKKLVTGMAVLALLYAFPYQLFRASAYNEYAPGIDIEWDAQETAENARIVVLATYLEGEASKGTRWRVDEVLRGNESLLGQEVSVSARYAFYHKKKHQAILWFKAKRATPDGYESMIARDYILGVDRKTQNLVLPKWLHTELCTLDDVRACLAEHPYRPTERYLRYGGMLWQIDPNGFTRERQNARLIGAVKHTEALVPKEEMTARVFWREMYLWEADTGELFLTYHKEEMPHWVEFACTPDYAEDLEALAA